MSAIAASPFHRAEINRANSQNSTGPRTAEGKLRSSRNALRHGLTAATPVLPSEDPAAYETHRRSFHDEYQPATATEIQLVDQLIDTSWRLKRIPLLEAHLLTDTQGFGLVDAHRLLSAIGVQSTRLSRQFERTLDQLRDLQSDRRRRESRDLKEAAALLELHKHKGIPWDPADHGFVFSKEKIARHSDLLMRQNEARQMAYWRFEVPPSLQNRGPSAAGA